MRLDNAQRHERRRLRWRIYTGLIVTVTAAFMTAVIGSLVGFLLAGEHPPDGMAAVGIVIVAVTIGSGHGVIGDIRRLWRSYRTDTAEERGRQLLMRLLTPEQRKQYRATGTFTVTGANGHNATIGNYLTGVNWHTANGRNISQCVRAEYVCKADDLIGKLLAIRNNPQRLASVSRIKLN